VLAGLPLAALRRRLMVRRSMPVMGTMAELTVVHHDTPLAERAIDAAFDVLRRVERQMTRFSDGSDIGRANLAAGREGVAVAPATATVLARALEWASASDGRFDPALGSVIELWDVADRHQPPPAGAVQPLAGRQFWRHVDLARGPRSTTVRFTDPGVRLDLGGIAKGHGVDLAVRALREAGVTDAIVNVGGDLYALGEAPDGGPWSVGIRSPHQADVMAATLKISDRAVATSGDYAQYFTWHGHRYHHLMDPTTAVPRGGPLHSVTVQADRCIDADAAATATFGLPRGEAERLVRSLVPRAEVLPLA
jgi:thiamine biosynthesis lipoprotein